MKIQIGAKAVVRHRIDPHLYLVFQRAGALPNGQEKTWDILGGRQEPEDGGSLLCTLNREVAQETNGRLKVVTAEPLNLQVFEPKEGVTVARFTYLCEALGEVGAADLSPEHRDVRWLPLQSVLALDLDHSTRETFLLLRSHQ